MPNPSAPIRGDQRSSAFVPPSPTDRKTQLYEILRTRVGPEKAITAADLGSMLGIEARTVRRMITDLILLDGHGEICANTGESEAFPDAPAGYFWASCAEDAERYRNVLISRIEDLQHRQRAAFHATQRLPRARNAQQRLTL